MDDDSKEEGTDTPIEANILGEVGADIPSANDPEATDNREYHLHPTLRGLYHKINHQLS